MTPAVENVQYLKTNGQEGYPAGDFVNEILKVLLGLEADLLKSAYSIFARADSDNARRLEKACPGWFRPLRQGWTGRKPEAEVRAEVPLHEMQARLRAEFTECAAVIERFETAETDA